MLLVYLHLLPTLKNMSNNLEGWDVKEQQRRADFIQHIYDCYKPESKTFTGLWRRFCLEEAGPYCRNMYFERIEAIEKFLEEQGHISEDN